MFHQNENIKKRKMNFIELKIKLKIMKEEIN